MQIGLSGLAGLPERFSHLRGWARRGQIENFAHTCTHNPLIQGRQQRTGQKGVPLGQWRVGHGLPQGSAANGGIGTQNGPRLF